MRRGALCREVLKLDGDIQTLAHGLKDSHSLLLFGRGYNYATALEAALKVYSSPPLQCMQQAGVFLRYCA